VTRLTYAQAGETALEETMEVDPTILVLGTLPAPLGSAPPHPLVRRYGADRVRRTPISEAAVVGMSLGAAMRGYRPVVNLRATAFSFVAYDQIVNQVARTRYMSGDQYRTPVLLRMFYITRWRTAAQHSQPAYSLYAHHPGLRIIVPASVSDLYGLTLTALQDENPCLIFEADILADLQEDVERGAAIPFGSARIVREGADVTIVAIGPTVGLADRAAQLLADEGVSVEVIDPRTLVPLDKQTIIESVAKTRRCLVVDESSQPFSAASEILAVVAESGVASQRLLAPLARLGADHVPIPYSPPLEDAVMPQVADIVVTVERMMATAGGR